jgi:hypothetical protein
MSYTSDLKDMRRHKRYRMDEDEIHVKMAFANKVQIQDISLGGMSIKADRRMNIGNEYLLKLESGKSAITTKVIVMWALLTESRADAKGNIIPIYLYGLKLINDDNERIKSFTDFINEHKKDDDAWRDTDFQANEFIDLSVQFKDVLEVFE